MVALINFAVHWLCCKCCVCLSTRLLQDSNFFFGRPIFVSIMKYEIIQKTFLLSFFFNRTVANEQNVRTEIKFHNSKHFYLISKTKWVGLERYSPYWVNHFRKFSIENDTFANANGLLLNYILFWLAWIVVHDMNSTEMNHSIPNNILMHSFAIISLENSFDTRMYPRERFSIDAAYTLLCSSIKQ